MLTFFATLAGFFWGFLLGRVWRSPPRQTASR